MKKIILSVLISMLLGLTARMVAQPILEYTFSSQYVGTYTPLTNPTVLFSGTFDDMTSASIDIPGIMFGGVERTSIKVNSNGWIAFGNATATAAWYPMNNTVAGADGVIVPFGTDLMNSEAGNSSVSYQIDGETVSVQWTNLRRFGVPGASENFSFQLIMDTANNAMFFIYDLDPLTSHGSYPQVGMKVGSAAAVEGGYVNRSVTSTNNWSTSDAGTANNSSCRLTINAPATFPESGLTYSWNGDYYGCMDQAACNYDAAAEVDNGSCEYCSCNPLCGCTDPNACNYDANATTDDGSCYSGITVIAGPDISVCPGGVTILADYFPQDVLASATWSILSGSATMFNIDGTTLMAEVMETTAFLITVIDENGCVGTDEMQVDVINCIYGCLDTQSCNYDPGANVDSGQCDYSCLGCTDISAMNYSADATMDDGSCIYPGDGSTCSNPIVISCGPNTYSAMTVGVANDNATSDAMVCGGPSSGGQRWYVYESPFTSEVTVSTINSMTNFDTYLKVYTGVCGDLVCVGQNDDIPGTGFQSQVVFNAVAGETYLIRVGGFVSMQGTFGLTFDCGGGCLDPEACNYNANAPFDDGSCTYGADCYGCTDTEAENYDPIAVYDEGCLYAPSVLVFHDLNGDGMHQSNETGLPNWPVYIDALNATIFSNAQGFVTFTAPASNFTLELINDGSEWISSNSSLQTISIPDAMTAAFGLIPATGETFMVAGPYDGFWDIIHCTDGYEAGVFINNTGSVNLNGTLTMTCDASFTPEGDVYSTIAPDQVAAGFAQWNIADFLAGANGLFSFHIDGPGTDNIGVTYPFEFNLVLVDGNGDEIYNESWTTTPFIACSYDPNDLTATPEGYADPHFILAGQRLEFRVRFQNTGNLPAEDILILDQIDPQVFDLSTFAPMYGSEEFTACLHDDGTIDFIFEDIYLTDSQTDEEASHGFVVYEVEARADLTPGTVLLNQANIFFDANPAIITNETYHTIFDCTSFTPMTGDLQVCDGNDVVLDATQDYVETYEWQLNGELIASTPSANLGVLTPNNYNVVLITGNPLCNETHEATVLINPNPVIDAGQDLSICEGESVVLNAVSADMIAWSDGIENGLSFSPEMSMTVIATATNDAQCTASDDVTVTVHTLPGTTISQDMGALNAPDGASWQWYHEGILMEGETAQVLNGSLGGAYFVIVTSEEGCTVTSETVMIVGVGEALSDQIRMYPNPMGEMTTITLPEGLYELNVLDVTGKLVMTISNCQSIVTLNRAEFSTGQYQINIKGEKMNHTMKLVVN